MRTRLAWFLVGSRIEVAWLVFALLNLAAMGLLSESTLPPGWETVPFHFVYVSFTILYGFRVWRPGRTVLTAAFVAVSTGLMTLLAIHLGREDWAEETEVPLMTLMFLAMVFHVHRRQQATAHAAALARERELDLERQRAFVSDASHELLTPITIGRGHLDVLRRLPAVQPDDVAEACDVVLGELDRMQRLITRLLLLEHAATPDFAVPEAIDVSPFLEAIGRRWRGAAERSWRIGPFPEVLLESDRERVELALDALLENAVAHTGPGDRVELTATATAGQLHISVRDSGPGIPAAALPHIWDRFYRVDPGRARSSGGAGLGLAIVQDIARALGGEASVRSELGAGSTFTIALAGCRGLAGDQTVAAAVGLDGDQRRELAPQPADVDIDDVRARVELVLPDRAQDPLA